MWKWVAWLTLVAIVVVGIVLLVTRPTEGDKRMDDLIENLD